MQLEEFLVKAKVNTYASQGEGGERVLEDGSREFVYEEDGWKYRDRYFGLDSFVGEEIVWKDVKTVWAMNYYGGLVSKNIVAQEVYNFLKNALRLVKEDRPFRGPAEFFEGDFWYIDASRGSVEKFTGIETIRLHGVKVYELKYHGGIIK